MLTADQLKRIDKHLRSENWLLNTDLIAELTDHYANAITDKLAQNVPFDTAMQDVHCSFGGRRGLLKMEENFQKTQAKTNARVYRNAFKQAFQWPGLGYTLCCWLGCYALLTNLPIAQLTALLNRDDAFVWLGILAAFVGLCGFSFWTLYRNLRTGTLPFSSWSSPVYVLVQSTVFVSYLVMLQPVQRLMATYPALGAASITLFVVHEWASLRLLQFVYRKRPA